MDEIKDGVYLVQKAEHHWFWNYGKDIRKIENARIRINQRKDWATRRRNEFERVKDAVTYKP